MESHFKIGFVFLIVLKCAKTELCAYRYKAKLICDYPYGVELMTLNGVRSKIECVTHCESTATCMSWTYKMSTLTCKLNAHIHPNTQSPCGSYVIYSEPKSRGCTSASQIAMTDTDPVTTTTTTTTPPTTTTTTTPPPTTTTTTTTPPPTTTTTQPLTTTIAGATTLSSWQGGVCKPGYRYDNQNSMCATDCTSFADSFQYTPDYIMVVSSVVYKQVSGLSDPAICRQHCLDETEFVCKTFQINGDLGNCYWTGSTAFEVPSGDFYVKNNFFVWHRDCV